MTRNLARAQRTRKNPADNAGGVAWHRPAVWPPVEASGHAPCPSKRRNMGSAERTCADEAARAGGAPACARIQQRDPFGRSADRRASSIACSLWTRQGKNSERARRRALRKPRSKRSRNRGGLRWTPCCNPLNESPVPALKAFFNARFTVAAERAGSERGYGRRDAAGGVVHARGCAHHAQSRAFNCAFRLRMAWQRNADV